MHPQARGCLCAVPLSLRLNRRWVVRSLCSYRRSLVYNGRRRRSPRGRRRRSWCGCGRHWIGIGRRHRDRRHPDRKERERVDVTHLVGCPPDAEVDIGHRELGLSARTHEAHGLTLGDGIASPDRVRAEVHERDGVAVSGLDRHGLPLARNGPGEGDRSRFRRRHHRPGRRTDVDPSMLSRVVGAALVECEERQHRPVDGPAPAESWCRDDQGDDRSEGDAQTHLVARPPLSILQTRAHHSKAGLPLSNVLTESFGRGGSARRP